MPDDSDYQNEAARVQMLLDECRRRLAARERIGVTAADLAVRHLFSLGLHLSAMEDVTDDPELRRRIQIAIEQADAAIAELCKLIYANEEDSDS